MIEGFTTDDLPERIRFSSWQSAVCETFARFECERVSSGPFFGEIFTRSAGHVHFTNVRSCDHTVKRGEQEIRHTDRETVLLHVHLAGSGIMTQDGRDVRLKRGDVAFYDSTRPCALVFDQDFDLLVVHLSRAILTRIIGQTERFTARALNADSEIASLLAHHLTATAQVLATANEAAALKLADIAVALIGTTVSSLTGNHSDQTWSRTGLIYRAKAYAEQNLSNPTLGPAQVAASLGISTRYLQSLFQAEQTTFSDWIWERRLAVCRHRLTETATFGCKIGQIAFECGFSDFSHFSRRFRIAFGDSPKNFRARHLKQRSILSRDDKGGPNQI